MDGTDEWIFTHLKSLIRTQTTIEYLLVKSEYNLLEDTFQEQTEMYVREYIQRKSMYDTEESAFIAHKTVWNENRMRYQGPISSMLYDDVARKELREMISTECLDVNVVESVYVCAL